MGKMTIYKCQNCGKEKTLLYGTGMFSFQEQQLISKEYDYVLADYCETTDNLKKDKILEILKSDICHLNKNFGYKMYYCPNCNNGETNFQFTLFTDKHGNLIPKYKCKNCNEFMRLATKEDNYKLYCNKCKKEINKETTFPMFGNWD